MVILFLGNSQNQDYKNGILALFVSQTTSMLNCFDYSFEHLTSSTAEKLLSLDF